MNRRLAVCAVCLLTTALLLAGGCSLAAIGAGALLHPSRRAGIPQPLAACAPRTFQGVGVTLTGWYCAATGDRRGTLVYLHGVADNRASGAGVVQRYVSRGFDVIAFDSRAHGQSSGDSCTYGYYEKQDLTRIIDTRLQDRVPVLPIHGADDRATAPSHSQRVFDALRTRKRLILAAAGHSQSLNDSVWGDVDSWIDGSLARSP